MIRLAFALALLATLAPGCGPDARRLQAEETVRLAGEAITDVQSSGGETPALEAALADAGARLEETEHALELWDGAGALPYATAAPCLAYALSLVRDALMAAGREVPESIDQAEAQAASATSAPCARARAQ